MGGKRLESYTVQELKEKLRKKGKPVSGNKAELIDRLRNGSSNSNNDVPKNVVDKGLYRRIRNNVKKRVKRWPSAYASGMVVKEYKTAGGRYTGAKKSSELDRWFREKWVNVCKKDSKGKYLECGTQKETKKYPYCRPSVRVNSKTPKTVGELGKKKLEKMCRKKTSKKRVSL